ncbi:hypothetical protein WJ96_07475 [Burkholderia ubonensis]|uniref:Cobalamin biosynthesis protein CobT VWA domain-containing protein n=1 Tax=Burkholderia ubonensis TaxID=101571 RepID=A0AAW3N2Y2_9BURK|nr:hypothetical protein [Burkholderia ubonensis]KVP75537.1 hypothetical protein WJ93_09265 [Burkholderia ubonensis]KVP98351.1 hypothetical protein WJ96_07475 [Burkholderia ubonensis]KVZ93049.1 hypothetical protein WL25_19135 [Burkholderia ubonensis]
MSSGFLLAEALSEVLRKPYHKGDVNITVSYAVEGLKVGDHRVMLKRNFDTACWVPPVGKRASHSIYYGDRMVARVLERFVKVNEITMPPAKEFADQVKKEIAEEKEALKLAKEAREKEVTAKRKSIPLPKVNPMHPQTRVLDAQLKWLRDNSDTDTWELFIEWLHKAVVSYGRHERGHARNTPQDLKQVNRDLRTLGIPFTYFNLFEDARMEHIERQAMGPFDWMMFEDLAPADNPLNIFLRCIQFEGEPDRVALESEEPYAKDVTRTVGHIAESVETYYKRACSCTTSEQLYPVITEFLAEFKDDLPPPPPEGEEGEGDGGGGSGSGTPGSGKGKKGKKGGPGGDDEDDDDYNGAGERAGDLSTAAEAADKGDEFFEDFDSDAEIVGGTDDEGKAAEEAAKDKLKGGGKAPPPKGGGGKGQGIPESIEPTGSGGRASERYFLSERAGEMDDVYRKRVDNLTGMLMRMFKSHTLPAALEAESHRMSGRHLARGEIRWMHKKVFGGKGKRKYSIVYDCSGSMGGRPDREGKLLLLALNNLAKRGFLEGTLILSGYVGGHPGWLSYQFPVKDELILRINPHHASEGLQSALADNLASIKGMDDVFVMTDACICDTPINRGQFAKDRIWPVGLYVGSTEAATEMDRHFPQNIIRDTIEQVVEAMLTRNRRTVG